ncbi:DUF4238 domain-containing protein [Paraburkholderia domus]|uniref:DUF4238 domain-containing protein n=1 Tax=Paraburkholderia domus TaxID=2793075 RepID=A0A9N8R6J1_9BURK|nr:DUF4238 domain-containing protein [Paraburkholderia domus]MBK5169938.1 DUF4238 domain-containing protein [Burkholderia sp. R-70211]CAE6967906.1 hypothetical protein R70211_07540 [Paraburkholderia domus]
MQQTKRHHFVPKAYLNAFCDQSGRLLVYRKDGPQKPLHQAPDATQFRRYYYSQPTPDGGRDNNKLEAFFSTIEMDWPATVAKLHRRENVNDRLESIFEFMAVQRARVPAARDVSEAALAQTLKDAMTVMLAKGRLPPPPPGLDDIQNQVQVSIDPHKSIHAMVDMIRGMGPLYRMLGIAAVHNTTGRPFLTSDNPVIWFDPSLPFDMQRPYTINPDGGPVLLFFPVSPKLALIGSTEYKDTFGRHGLLHSDVPDETWVDLMNAQVCRFAYEAVIATSGGQEEVIAEFAHISPVHEAVPLQVGKGSLTIHRQVFGPRVTKPKWRNDE